MPELNRLTVTGMVDAGLAAAEFTRKSLTNDGFEECAGCMVTVETFDFTRQDWVVTETWNIVKGWGEYE